MLSLTERLSRQRFSRNWGIMLLTIIVALAVLPISGVSTAFAQDDAAAPAAAAPDAGADDAATPTELQSRNFLSWMIQALGWFWMLIFAALSFVMWL